MKEIVNMIGAILLVVNSTLLILEVSNSKTEYKRGHDSGYKKGYHDAKLIYECEHDQTECEILSKVYE